MLERLVVLFSFGYLIALCAVRLTDRLSRPARLTRP